MVVSEIVKAVITRQPGQDPLDALLGPIYTSQYAERALQRAVAPLQQTLVVLSRVYPGGVVIDFETAERPFHEEGKRRWCTARGWVYIPVRKAERLTVGEIENRIHQARAARAETSALTALATVDARLDLNAPEFLIPLQEAAERIVTARHPKLKGGVRTKRVLATVTALSDRIKGESVATLADALRWVQAQEAAVAEG